MRYALLLICVVQSLHSFEFTQAVIPLSPFGNVVYDIYRPTQTKCEAHISFRMDEEDPKGNYRFTLMPSSQSTFTFTNEIDTVAFSFAELKNIRQVFP